MSEVKVTRTHNNKVCCVEINLPEKRNILTKEVIKDLINVFSSFSEDKETNIILLSGKGNHFCAGGDLRWMLLDPEAPDLQNIQEVNQLFQLFHTLHSCPIPIIGKIHGSVYGGGLGLVSVCDIAVAHRSSAFCFSEVKLGLIPATIAPFILNKLSISSAKHLILSAEVFKAEKARDIGLIHFVGDFKECDDYIHTTIDKLLSYDRVALRQSKQMLNTIPYMSFEESKNYCVQSLVERRKNPQVMERISKFLKFKK